MKKIISNPKNMRLSMGSIFFVATLFLFSQAWAGINTWTSIGPQGAHVHSIAFSPNYATDGTVFVGTANGGVYKSTDSWQNWTQINNGLESIYINTVAVSPNYAVDATVFAATDGHLYKSTNGGLSWTETGLPAVNVQPIAISPNYAIDGTIFAASFASGGHLYKSTNGGLSWTDLLSDAIILTIAISPNYAVDDTIFLGTYWDGGVLKSTDGGQSWQYFPELAGQFVQSIAISPNYAVDGTIFVATDDSGLYRSTNGGQNWTQSWLYRGLWSVWVGSIVISPNYADDATILAAADYGTTYDKGIYMSNSKGCFGFQMNTGLTNIVINDVAISPNYINDATIFAVDHTVVSGGHSNAAYSYTFSPPLAITNRNLTITASAGSNGSISPLGAVTVNNWDNQIFTITPDANYHIANVLVDDDPQGGITSYMFTCVGDNHTISASFAINSYTITASAGANGSISPSGAVTVNHGSDQSFNITPNMGYHVTDVLVDSSSVGPVTSYTFHNVTEDHTISASFAINTVTHTITASPGANGAMTPSGFVAVNHNATQNFTVAPSGGYQAVMSGTCGGNLVGSTYTTNPITANCAVTATFNPTGSSQSLPPDYNVQVPVPVSLPSGGSGSVIVTFSRVTSGGTLSISATNTPLGGGPPTGFKFLGTYYNVTFTGNFSGYIYITFPYNGSSIPSGKEANLRLYHWRTSGGWEDCSYSLDTTDNTITGRVTSLSPFGMGYSTDSGSDNGSSSSSTSTGANENMIALIAILAISAGVFILRRHRWLKKS